MGRAAVASVVALLAAAAASSAGDAREQDATPPKPPAPLTATPVAPSSPAASAPAGSATQGSARASKPAPSTPTKRLNLGPYVDPYGPVAPERLFDVPHFETRVEVLGKAMDSAALTAKMEWWMRDFEPLSGAVSHSGSAPSVEEMREYRPGVTPGANIMPIIDWLVDKLNKKP